MLDAMLFSKLVLAFVPPSGAYRKTCDSRGVVVVVGGVVCLVRPGLYVCAAVFVWARARPGMAGSPAWLDVAGRGWWLDSGRSA